MQWMPEDVCIGKVRMLWLAYIRHFNGGLRDVFEDLRDDAIHPSQREFPYPNYFTMLFSGIQGQKIYFKYLHDLEFHPLVFVVEMVGPTTKTVCQIH